MNQKLITIWAAWAFLILSSNSSFGQEIADVLKTKHTFPQTEQLEKELSDTLNYKPINKQQYQEQKIRIIKKIWNDNSPKNNLNKQELETLLLQYLSNIQSQIIQNPELLKKEVEMLYYDCEFADIQIPKELELILKEYWSRIINKLTNQP